MARGRFAVRALEFYFIHQSCDDPWQQLGPHVLDLIRERLGAAAYQHAEDQADRALQEILAMEEVRDGAVSCMLSMCFPLWAHSEKSKRGLETRDN